MKVLLDHCVPATLRKHLPGHHVVTAGNRGWEELGNGGLLSAAEAEIDLFITTDQNMRYQQNMSGHKIAILELGRQRWPDLEPFVREILAAVNSVKPGEYRMLLRRSG